MPFNALLNDKIETLADDKINVTENLKFVLGKHCVFKGLLFQGF